MKTITLPDELNLGTSQPVQVFDYHSSQEVAKQKIILNQNTFSFLTEGTKEVIFDNSALSIDNSKFLIMKSGHCLMTEKLSHTRSYRSVLLFFTNEILLKFIRKAELNKIEQTEHINRLGNYALCVKYKPLPVMRFRKLNRSYILLPLINLFTHLIMMNLSNVL
ncbi:MAG: hypothetical protein QM610_02310 [Chitinophagaceae bacterium]